jgi:pimeloyl-ACP methyl ester carboxylesterase
MAIAFGGRTPLVTTAFATSPDGVRIAYDVAGSGPPLVLLHGGGHDRSYWHDADYVARLKDAYRVIAIDARGSGESDQPADPSAYTTQNQGDDVLAVVDAWGIDRFALWGYSYGGNIGRYLASRSARVTKFVMIGIPFGRGAFGDFRKMIERLTEQPSPAVAWLIGMLDWPVNEPRDLRCPTLWLVGSNNPFAMASVDQYRATLTDSQVRVQIVEGLSHQQEFSQIDRVLPVMRSFMEE